METQVKYSIAREFSRYPAGRYRTDGPWSGQKLQEDVLLPLLSERSPILIDLDGTAGYGSSFLEEAFGGTVRALGLTLAEANRLINLSSADDSLVEEIQGYMRDAAKK
jgi:hypothetical protein